MSQRTDKVQWLERLLVDGGHGCRDWPWGKDSAGYGQVWWEGRVQRLTHVVLSLTGQPRPPAAEACHSCDRPPCCAPWHLRWGTPKDNAADRLERGQQVRGERVGNAVLTEADVRQIRALRSEGWLMREIAGEVGTCLAQVSRILRGETWTHVR